MRYPLILLCILCCAPCTTGYGRQTPKAEANPVRVLFVGNSYTHGYLMPYVVSEMAKSRGQNLDCRMSVAGGVTLGNHFKGIRQLTTLEQIRTGGFDMVVLQDQSMRPTTQPERTQRDIGRLCGPIREAGAKPFVFLTWARQARPEMLEQLTRVYTQAAKAHGATVAPVGIAWQRALEQKPDIALYMKDGSHPSDVGAYLNACVFYAALTGESPIGLPREIKAHEPTGPLKTHLRLSEEDALICQQAAEQAVKSFASTPP